MMLSSRSQSTVAVIIPTFRRPQEVRSLVGALLRGTVRPTEILVVDNDPEANESHDEAYGGFVVRHLRCGRGLDLAGARNMGWQACTSELCFFIDDDNIVETTTVEQLIWAANVPDIGMVAPLILRADAPDVIWCGGIRRSMTTTRTVFLDRGAGVTDSSALVETDDMPDALLVPRRVLSQIGGFDEARFPFHYDEADLAARIRTVGLRCIVARKSRVYHSGFAGSDPASEWLRATNLHGGRRAWLQARARVYFHRRHSRGLQRISALAIFIPVWALLTSAACLRAGGRLTAKTTVLTNLFGGLIAGYTT